jgi:putative membrane protein (TIGR04086 family)
LWKWNAPESFHDTSFSHAIPDSRIGCGKGGDGLASGKRRKRTKIAWKRLLLGALIGMAAMLLLVLLLTLFLYQEWLPESAISAGNTIIKILAALAAGIFIGLSKEQVRWYFGGITAALALVFAVAAMSFYLGAFRPTWNLAADLLMSFAIGSAASAVFLRRKTE